MKLPIHTAVISHDEGATQYVSASHGELIEQIGGYCREHWHSVSDDPPPQNTRDLIDAYFYDNVEDSLEVSEDSIEVPESIPSIPRFTVFCQEAGGSGTIHIDTHEAADLESAIIAGKRQCIHDWSSGFKDGDSPWNMESVHCLGVAAGDVEILHWEDQPQ